MRHSKQGLLDQSWGERSRWAFCTSTMLTFYQRLFYLQPTLIWVSESGVWKWILNTCLFLSKTFLLYLVTDIYKVAFVKLFKLNWWCQYYLYACYFIQFLLLCTLHVVTCLTITNLLSFKMITFCFITCHTAQPSSYCFHNFVINAESSCRLMLLNKFN